MSAKNVNRLLAHDLADKLLDPGSGGTLQAFEGAFKVCGIRTAAAENRTIAAPDQVGKRLTLYFESDGGDATLTVTDGYDQAGNTSITFGDVGDMADLVAIDDNGTVRWEALKIVSSSETLEQQDLKIANGFGLIVGHTGQETISDGGGATDVIPEVQVLGTAQADSTLMIAQFSTTNASGPMLALVKGGNAAIGSHTAVADNEYLGRIIAFGDDGTDIEAPAAEIRFIVDGSPGTGDMPGEIEFYTTASGGETLTLAMSIRANQNVVIHNGNGLIVGDASQETVSNGDGATDLVPEVQVLGTAQADSSMLLAQFSTTATRAGAPTIALAKGGNAAIGSHTIVTDDEVVGNIIAFGDDGVDLETPIASIQFVVDGSPAADQIGGSIEFYTTPDGSTTLTNRWTINEAGNLVAITALDVVVQANTDSALEFSDGTTKVVDIDSRTTLKNVHSVTITGFPLTIASEAAAHLNSSLNLAAKTITYTGTTGTTSSFGAMLNVGELTITDASTMTLDAASAVHVNALAAAGGNLTISASYMISTSVSDCFLTNAGVWTDTTCWESTKQNVLRSDSAAAIAVNDVLDRIKPATWQYRDRAVLPSIDPETGAIVDREYPVNDRGRNRCGIVYDDLPGELRAPGEERGVSAGLLASFSIAGLKTLRDEFRERLDAIESRLNAA